jgi:hypothetical protein
VDKKKNTQNSAKERAPVKIRRFHFPLKDSQPLALIDIRAPESALRTNNYRDRNEEAGSSRATCMSRCFMKAARMTRSDYKPILCDDMEMPL